MNIVSNIVDTIKNEFNGYSKNIKITLIVLGVIVFGFFVFAIQILFFGLGYTGMNNSFTWGQWIAGDLVLVALGGGAFFTGFLLYIFRVDKLEPIINSTVLLGFLCYLFTFVFLLFDLGQPLRCWFGFIYPNWGPNLMPTSMLTEVFFCLSFYFGILCVEMIPIVLKHKILDKFPILHYTGHYLHKLMWIFAAAGTFLSLFHQGSLGGGMWDVLYAKAQFFRPHHQFFLLAVVAATAGGTSFMTLVPYIAGKVMKKQVVPKETFLTLAKISSIMFTFYILFRAFDVYTMIYYYVPLADRSYLALWGGYYGIWMVVLEFILLLFPIIFLSIKKVRENEKFLVLGTAGGILGITISKFSVLLHGFSVPNFSWRGFISYTPSVQEWFIFLGGFATMILIYMWFAKYMPLFPSMKDEE